MGSVLTFRLPSSGPRRKVAERRAEVIVIDSRRSRIDPARTIHVPVLRRPPDPYNWANELDE